MVFTSAIVNTEAIDNKITELFEDFNVRADITREDLIDFIRNIVIDEIRKNY